ncbi:type 2 isopentenyl-diphosphate Delta-isomerase [Patescibacteria group bacterium]|nr:type 2 isopentenyl-diphosphate Delta-isomerase [Patescibacteria group bacterium]
MSIHSRKKDHLDICFNDTTERNHNSFDNYIFTHNALPEIDFNEIDISQKFLGYTLQSPLLISGMTGGTRKGMKINHTLAKAAEQEKIAFGLGSQRILLEDEGTFPSFEVKPLLKSVPLIGNLGAVSLNYGLSADDVNRAIDLVSADALFLHLNPLQEVIQHDGDTNFSGLLAKIQDAAAHTKKPLFIKEIGTGISYDVAKKLFEAGISTVDVSGKGGTTWSYIESKRNEVENRLREELFFDWGINTPEALKECSRVEGLTLLAGGGIRTGLDVAKSIALGARICSLGLPLLKSTEESVESVCQYIQKVTYELKVAMFCVGAKNLHELSQVSLRCKQD